MASLFQHLRVLLWKNWLSIKRQPLWSFTLIAWPVFLFILLATIRTRFPPEPEPNCYLAPRNLPSAGFFPFLQTVLCGSDATCKSTPYTPEDLLPKLNSILPISRKRRRSANLEKDSNPSSQSADAPKSRNGSLDKIDPAANLKNTSSSVRRASIHVLNKILRLAEMQKPSVANLKAEICEVMPANASSQSLLWEVIGTNTYQTFCFSNLSLMESFFQEFRNQTSKLKQDSQYQMSFLKEIVSFLSLISEVQNDTSLWRILLMAQDLTQGVTNMKNMVATLRNTNRKVFSKYNFAGEELVGEAGQLSKDVETNEKSLQLLKDLQEKFSTAEMKNLELFKESEHKTILGLAGILQQAAGDQDNKLKDLLTKEEINRPHNFTSSLLQNSSNGLPFFDIMAHLKEVPNIHNLARSIWELAFLNKTDFNTTKTWQTIKTITSHRFSDMPERFRRYLTSMQQIPSLFANSLLKPTTIENFPEKLLALQKIFDIVADVNSNHNYLLMQFINDMMQKIQNSINESQWNEFNVYWHISEILRSAKWNDTDIIAYGQVLDILHNGLYTHHNGSGRPLKTELEKLTKFVNYLLKENGEESISGANVSMVLEAIMKTLHVLEDLEEKYLNELVTVNPLMNVNNETLQRLFQIFKEGRDILSDPRLTEASSLKKIDTLFSFSHKLLFREFYRMKAWPNSSVEAKVSEFLYLTLSPFLRGDIQANERLPDCTIKDFHLISVEVLLSNATLKEALRGSNCSFLFTAADFENRTTHHHTFTELFHLAIRNLKSMPTFDTFHKDKRRYFPNAFQCLIKSLQLSSGFLSKWNSFYNYKNPWIQKMHDNLTAISDSLSQSNLTCQEPLFGNMDVINESFVLHLLSHFMLNETDAHAQNVSGSPSVWNQALVSFILLHSEPHKNATISKLLEVNKNAVNQSKWKYFSKALNEVANMLSSNQNVTTAKQYVQLLEMTRKALILVVTSLAPNKTETHQFLESLSWGMKASYLEEILSSIKSFFNVTSEIDYKNYLGGLFNTLSPPIDVLVQRLLYTNPHWEETKQALNLTTLFLGKTSFKLAMIWRTIQEVMLWKFDKTQEIPLQFSKFLLNSTATKNILEQLLTFQDSNYNTTNVNMSRDYPLVAYLSGIMQRTNNASMKSRWNEWSAFGHIDEQLRSVKLKSTNLDTHRHFLNILHQRLAEQDNEHGLDFSLELETLTRLLSDVLQRFLFSEFENNFLQLSPNNGFRSYLTCIMNVSEGLASELSENAALPPNIAQLKRVLFTSRDTYKNYLSVPEILMLRVSRLLHLRNLTSLLCDRESIRSLQQTCQLPDVNFAELCDQSELHKKLLHSVELSDRLVTSFVKRRSLIAEFQEIVVGDPKRLQQEIYWLQEDVPLLKYFLDIPKYVASLNSVVNITKNTAHPRKQGTLIDLFRNVDGLRYDLRNTVGMSTESVNALLEMPLPENKIQLIFQIIQLELCDPDAAVPELEVITAQLCNLSFTERAHKSYILGVTLLHYLDVGNFIYKVFFPKELQTPLDNLLDLLKDLDHFKKQVASDVHPLFDAIHLLKKLQQSRNAPFSKALFQTSNLTMNRGTFKTISKALCNMEISPLFFESLLPDFEEQNVHHPSVQDECVQHIKKKFGIPQDLTPFCTLFFLDLVKTPSGALIWSFLKPLLFGRILYTPDTPETEAIMEKSNSTLKLMADLIQNSQKWLDNAPLLKKSLTMLDETIPVLKNALQNPFIQVFIRLTVHLDAVDLLNQIDELDDIRLELQNNADVINQLNILAGLSVNVSSCILFDRIKPFRTEEELEKVAKDFFLKNELLASIIFKMPSDRKREESATSGGLSLPPLINYTIRMSSKISQTTQRIREKVWTVGPHNSVSQSQIYSRAFVYIQDSIDRAIIELQTGKNAEEIAVQVQATPYPCYSKDMFLTSVTYSLPFSLMAAWILFVAAFVKKLVQEKDLRLYEYMKMMGVNSSSHFFAWFIECATFLLITITCLIIVFKVGNILPNINVVILFLYLVDYSLSIIAMCYLISVFFNNTNIAALVACLIYILTFFPFIVLLIVENHISFSGKSLLGLLSPTAFSYASQYIARYEEKGIGIQWDNMYESPMSGDNTNFGWMCWLILIDSFIYFILGWYIRNVFPGKYGMAAPWYFPLLPSYWAERYGYIPAWSEKIKDYLFTNFFLRKQPTFPEKMYVQSALSFNLEPEPTNLTLGVSLHGITKTYGSKAAVQNLNLNFYEGNITSLLGHNGAGKTTTISILTGLFPASSGTIFVYGKDIRSDQDIIRKNMGICMQHNVLFSYLTTKEHLLLYGYIKIPHWSKQELYEEVERTLKQTGLYNHRHKLAGSLSGGMKRKLSISIALLGGSKVVILDEPTTGVDPCSRRGIWEIISKNRKGRTIILSTHHLDEAEVLSDRIAFLENGGLKCCGSPFYLKETFSSGYHLTLTKKKSSILNVAEDCDTSAVTAMIQSHLPDAFLKEDIGGELVYALPPFNSKVSSAYQSLLSGLDSGLSDLHIGCYGISDSTVEEVFLNLTKDLEKNEQADAELSQEALNYTLENDDLSSNNFTERDDQALVKLRKPGHIPLLVRRATALFIKRFHHTRRNVKGFIAQVLLPVLFVTAAMGLGNLRTKVEEYPALHLSPSLYGSSGQADFFGNYNETTDSLVASLLSFPGADNTCLNKSNLECFNKDEPGEWVFSGNQSAQYSACNCTDSRQVCPKINLIPPHKRTFFSRIIYNLTGHDVETYLLVTAKGYVQKRYGGWSFGLPLTSDLQFDILPIPANRTVTKVWYNPEGYHSLPAYLNSLNNFILRANLPKENSSGYGISVVAHPYPGGESQEQAMLSSLLDIIVSMSVLIGYSITTASFVLYVVKEHQTKAKQLQHISGISVTSYWVTNFIYDLVYFLVPVTLSVGIISAFQIPAFFNDNNILAVFLLLLLFGYATFSWMYLLAGIFKETGMAFLVYVCINLFFGVNTIITHSVVFLISQEKATDQGLHDLAETLRHVFLMFPQFCFGYGLIELSQYQALMGFLKAYGVDYPNKTFEMDMISSKLLAMFIQGTIFFSIRLLIDDGTFQKIWYNILEFLFSKVHGKPPHQLETIDEEEDKDVQAERERVTLGLADCDILQLQNLTKIYHLPHRRIVAVKNVSIGIPAGECFGLLGVNGAGKTTIFKMLTGDIAPSSGRLLVRDESGSLNDIDDAHWSLFGYCPQEDALDDWLTVEEHMYYYARLHGIPEKHIKGIVLQLLYRLNLMPYKHRITSMCSYGTNRKLSAALALLGKPSILLLDEPSSGMDPNAKRHLWKIITEEVQNQCSVILTSHSMEECEALCTRLAVMVNGRFQCMGSLQHIKSRFGRGFTVKMHLNNDAVCIEKLTEFLQTNFPNTHLKDHQLNMVEYHVPVSAGGVANIFQLLESNKAIFRIRHFSVSQTTLEEVFINFAKAQTGPDISDASSDIGSDSFDLSSQDSNITAIC
ncbi:glucosylceramide transporter ABCA12 [Elgaria multicarinata webbii]|uniref:glucosylceramide transporter ABCA12 n=1 Tax=Elgaria multicarinata webbii TaxID=159646 RepID=UPI002FCD6B80